jgi:hypothetical protein
MLMKVRTSKSRLTGGASFTEEDIEFIDKTRKSFVDLPKMQEKLDELLPHVARYNNINDFWKYLSGELSKALTQLEKESKCGFGRLRQFSGTCWFNSAINALFLSDIKHLFVKSWDTEWRYKPNPDKVSFFKKAQPNLEYYFDEVYTKTQNDTELATAIKSCKLHQDIAFYIYFLTYFMFVRNKPFNPESKNDSKCSCLMAGTMKYDKKYTIPIILEDLYGMPFKYKNNNFKELFYTINDVYTIKILYEFTRIVNIPYSYSHDNITFDLTAASIDFWSSHNKKSGHAIAAFVCEGKYYIYNSDTDKIEECDWRNLEEVKALMVQSYNSIIPNFDITTINYYDVVYLRRDWEVAFPPSSLRTSAQTRPGP